MPDSRRRTPAVLLCIAVAAALLLTGCTTASGPPEAEPSVRGVVTQVSPGTGTNVTLMVVWTDDAAVGPQAGVDAAAVSVTSATKRWKVPREGAEPVGAPRHEFAVGNIVEAWFSGPVAESYPVQASASDVLVTGNYTGEPPTPPGLEPPPRP